MPDEKKKEEPAKKEEKKKDDKKKDDEDEVCPSHSPMAWLARGPGCDVQRSCVRAQLSEEDQEIKEKMELLVTRTVCAGR